LSNGGLLEARRIEQDKRPDKNRLPDHEDGPSSLARGAGAGVARRRPQPIRTPRVLRRAHAAGRRAGDDRGAARPDQRAHLAILEEIERDPAVVADTYPYLTLLAGKENAKAVIRWAEQALQILDERA
jgi:hypothetical protein